MYNISNITNNREQNCQFSVHNSQFTVYSSVVHRFQIAEAPNTLLRDDVNAVMRKYSQQILVAVFIRESYKNRELT